MDGILCYLYKKKLLNEISKEEKVSRHNEIFPHFSLIPFPSRLGLVVGFGASLVRDSASVMIGHYFKRRRQFVEMIVMAGEGVGIALFSVIIKEGIG